MYASSWFYYKKFTTMHGHMSVKLRTLLNTVTFKLKAMKYLNPTDKETTQGGLVKTMVAASECASAFCRSSL